MGKDFLPYAINISKDVVSIGKHSTLEMDIITRIFICCHADCTYRLAYYMFAFSR
jgi:hypothetical protein